MSFHFSRVLLCEPVAQRDELVDASSVSVEPRSQTVCARLLVVLLFRSDAELQVVRTGAEVVDR